jgi:hypothetical protein
MWVGCKNQSAEEGAREPVSNSVSIPVDNEGWTYLFNGSTLEGWRGVGKDTIPKYWTIENGTIRKLKDNHTTSLPDGQPVEGGDLMTIASFDNFELYFEWKILKGGNSGVKYNVSEDLSQQYGSEYSAIGFEYQLLDEEDTIYAGIKNSQQTASLYDIKGPERKIKKQIGEFNSSKIVVDGNQVEHWLNGEKVLEYQINSIALDSLVSLSKFRDLPKFASKRNGHIVLQNHHDDVWFRRLMIRPINQRIPNDPSGP